MATYLIIGGSSGIGRALVDQLLTEGHNVAVWAR
jgi:NAD(P)-dependent dehydrogenase (short-subunit alcohol dehydrogenase family)